MKIIAHRGASGEYPENSLVAFEQAIKQKADGIELDAQYHQASGQFILMHDQYLKDNTGIEYHFNELSLVQLQSKKFSHKALCTLAEALHCINGRCLVNIEIKSATTEIAEMSLINSALFRLLTKIVNDKIFTWDDLIISSFNHPLLAHIKSIEPAISIAALITGCPLTLAQQAQALNAVSVNPAIEFINKKIIEDAHRRNIAVWVYTVDRPRDLEFCYQLGVDGIFTNWPKRSRNFIEALSCK
jgi:glycerophosphoryl diester phosphodiesterase